MAVISEGEWKAELERLAEVWRTERQTAGLTGPEWARKLGIGVTRMRLLLVEAKSRGLLLMGVGTREALDGRMSRVKVYAMKKSPAASGRLVRAGKRKRAGS